MIILPNSSPELEWTCGVIDSSKTISHIPTAALELTAWDKDSIALAYLGFPTELRLGWLFLSGRYPTKMLRKKWGRYLSCGWALHSVH